MPVLAVLGMIIFSLFGLADSSYLTYEKFSHVTPNCNLSGYFDCGTVLNSPWSSIGPVPLSLFGMGFYLMMFVLATVLLLQKNHHPKLPLVALLFASFGFFFSAYLTGVQAFVLRAFCFFCVMSAGSSTLLFASTFAGHRVVLQKRKAGA